MYNFKTELARKSWLSGLPLPSTLFPSSCRLGLNGAHPFHLFLRLPWRTLGFLIVSLVFSPQKWNKIQGGKEWGICMLLGPGCSRLSAVAGQFLGSAIFGDHSLSWCGPSPTSLCHRAAGKEPNSRLSYVSSFLCSVTHL